MLTVSQFAARLGVSPHSVRVWIRKEWVKFERRQAPTAAGFYYEIPISQVAAMRRRGYGRRGPTRAKLGRK